MSQAPMKLSKLLAKDAFPPLDSKEHYERALAKLQLRMLRIQQGIYHDKRRAIIALEGFDAAGKGGVIRRMVELLDPRGVSVVPIGPPTAEEQGRHSLWRFWKEIPPPGKITIFDRTWYGRVLVERVDKLCGKEAWKRAYEELRQFERQLVDSGVDLVKIFVAISKKEQWKRFELRIIDPYKQWKISEADIRAREKWDDYVRAVDDMFAKTDQNGARWHLVAGDHKWYARVETLRIVTNALGSYADRMEARALAIEKEKLLKELRRLKR
jgi:AMP-polyphosphate phosphotransferase